MSSPYITQEQMEEMREACRGLHRVENVFEFMFDIDPIDELKDKELERWREDET